MKLKKALAAVMLSGMLGRGFAIQTSAADEITGLIRVGAYDVEVQNASQTNWVNGDLVITYLNTNATVAKSFTLPHPTTGRLLVVGGGGAGGQDSSRDEKYGLPGGGGAGGMVTNDNQAFSAVTYTVAVGGGGAAPRKTTRKYGASGKDSKVSGGGLTITAKGGGGGGVRDVGQPGGCGGGGSAYSGSKGARAGGSTNQTSPGFGKKGGAGNHALYGGGGGGAGGAGGDTAKEMTSGGKTTYGHSGAGGAGICCDITGTSVEYARGGDGGVPRVYAYQYYDEKAGREVRTNTQPVNGKINGYRAYYVEASDGKPGLEGRGNGGGGGGHYSDSATYAGSGGGGVVIVRIPPYSILPVDAVGRAFPSGSVAVEQVGDVCVATLQRNVTGPIFLPDNVGAVEIKLNGHALAGADGAAGDDITPGGSGQPAIKIVPHEYECAGAIALSVTGTGSLRGGSGGMGYPGGTGAPAVSAEGFAVDVAPGIGVATGTVGESLVQHPHKWAYAVEDGKIIAYCVAEDGEPCSYRDHSRGPFVAVSAADAAYTAMRYDELTAVNGITPVTGIVIAPEMYVGRDGTDYPESSTPPREQGAYTVSMRLGDLKITSDFTITEPKPSQDSVYQAWKTAERKGRDVQIVLSATFDGSKAINDGNVLFLGSRCNAHSMATGTVEKSINAMTRYANVRWYAYGSSDSKNNLVNQLTKKGEKVAYTEKSGKVTGETVHLEGGNHFVHKEMMDDLYAELVEKRNRTDGYDLIILEFDGDLLCRNGESPYQLVYSLPTGWTDAKAAKLHEAMLRYYEEDRVVWIVPDVNQPKSDAGYTGEYPWTSNPDFIWQRAFLNATEAEGYECPLQKNYEDADQLVGYLQEVLVGHFFSNAIIKDKLADGLTIKKVTPQMRPGGGIWRDFEGGPSHYTIPEPRSGTTVAADVERVERQVTVTFDMKAEQAWACEHDQVIGDDFRVVIDAELDAFFSGPIGAGEWQETNEGPATFIFTESNLDDDEEDFTITIEKDSPKIQNVKLTPVYSAEDVVKTYDGRGTNIVVKPVDPAPDEAIIRYSLDEHGVYVDTLALTEVCDKTKVWFEIVDTKGDFNTVTNFATVTILPAPHKKQDGVTSAPYSGVYDGEGHTITVDPDGGTVTYLVGGAWVPEPPLYTNRVEATGVVFRVTREGHETFEGTNTVTVTRREATLTSGTRTDFPYDGTPHAFTNLTVSGFVEGEGLASTSAWATVTAVAEGEVANAFAYALLPNTLADNYEIAVTTGRVAVVAAPVGPKSPAAPGENPGDEPQPGEGPTLWARNVVKVYDGVGTNVLPQVHNAVGGNGFAYEYSTDEVAWTADLAFTNVVSSQRVFFRAIPEGTDPNYVGATAFAYVTIQPRPATITFTASDKVYDGTVAATCTSTNFAGLVAGEGFALDASAMAFAFDSPDVGAGKTVAATGYDDSLLTPLGDTLASNYAFAFVPTTTASITAAKQTGVASDPYVGAYDGAGHTIAVSPDGGTVTYLVGGAWVPEPPLFTNRVEATGVVFRVTREGHETFEGTNAVTVTRREATLTSGTRTDFPYDGTPHAFTNLTVSGFVEGEGLASTSAWATVTAVAEGEVANAFAYGLLPNTLAGNYVITVTTGKIAVVAAPVSPKNPAGDDPAANPDDEPQPGEGVTLWAQNVVKVYDGVGTNVLAGVFNAVPGNGFAYEYSTDEVAWTADLAFTNVVSSQRVFFRAVPEGTDPNYVGATAFAYVTIQPRPATITFTASDKVYDGTDAATCTATNFAGLVAGEGFALDASAMAFAFDSPDVGAGKTVAATGYDDSLLTPLGDTLASNYAFAFVPTTTASITAAKLAATSSPYSGVYDGEGHTIAVSPDGGSVTYLVGGAWVPEPPLFTNRVDATDVVFRVTKAGYDDFVGTNAVTVLPRAVTLVSADHSFPYDGSVHVWHVLSGTDGFVAGETYATNWTGSVTDVGTAPNAFDIAWHGTAKASNYELAMNYGTLTVLAKSIGPDPSDPTNPADPDIDISPVDPQIYDGQPKEPDVVVTDGMTELTEGVDYAVAYGNNTNATEEAYAVITGIGNYGGCFTNSFAILPREVTLMSGAKTMYLDPARPGDPVACSNGLVWVECGSFVTNAVTGDLDGFEATVTGYLESSVPAGPVPNDFTVVVKPGLETNYFLTLIPGELAILSTPANAHEEVHEIVPSTDGEGVLDVVMDNHDAGKYASDRPPELTKVGELVEKDAKEDVEVRLLISTNYLEKSFGEVTNEVVEAARGMGKSEREIGNYTYDALDIAVNETRWSYESVDDAIPTNVVMRDIGNEIDADHMLTITIPYEFRPKLVEFSVWRNHTNDTGGVEHDGVVELPYSDTAIPGTETWKTNATSVILRVHKFSVYVFKSLVLSAPSLTGRLQWKYFKAENAFYAGLDVVCTNGDPSAISNLCYVYEDRADCYLRDLASADRLSKTSSAVYGGKTFGLVRLDDVAAALRASALDTTNRYGVAEATFADPSWKDRHVVPTTAERRIALATADIVGLKDGDPTSIDRTLGYLTWQEAGSDTLHWCALSESLGVLPVDSYTIRFLAGGGGGAMAEQLCKKGKVYNLATNAFTPPPGKEFACWACSNGRRYDGGILVFDLSEPGKVVTMTAVWK